MAHFANHCRYPFEFMGNGDTFRIAQYEAGAHKKTLIPSIVTTADVAVTGYLNELTGSNSFDLGDDMVFLAVSTALPEATSFGDLLDNHPTQYVLLGDTTNKVVDVAAANFPPIANPDGSFILDAAHGLYQVDATQGDACRYIDDDAVKATIAEWKQLQPPVPVPAWSFVQPTVSQRADLAYNSAIGRNVVKDGYINFVEPAAANATANYYELVFGLRFGTGNGRLQLHLGSNYWNSVVHISLAGVGVFRAGQTSFASPADVGEFYVYRLQIPKSNLFNGGKPRLYRNGVLIAEQPHTVNRPSFVQGTHNRRIQISGGAELTGLVYHNEELSGALLDNVQAGIAHTCNVTL